MVPLLIASTALLAMGSISSANAQAANLQAQSNAQNYTSELQKQQAQQVTALSTEQAAAQNRSAKIDAGLRRASIAESLTGWGETNSMLIDESAANAELDRQNIAYSGRVGAQGLNAQAQQSRYAGQVASSQIPAAYNAGIFGAGAAILNGAGSYTYNRKGGRF